MIQSSIRLVTVALALSLVTVAEAQTGDWSVAPAIVYTDDDVDRNIDDSVAGGQISVGRTLTEHLSLEGLLGYSDINDSSDAQGGRGEKHLDVSANLLAFPNRDRTFAPYFLFGIGYLGVDYSTGGEENRPTGTLGAGFKWALGQSKVSLRGEYRARLAYESGDNLTDLIATLGVQFNFGKERPAAPHNGGFDTDGDGVIDHWDQCRRTPNGVEVDENGCPLVYDNDGDGVGDDRDQCPNTPGGIEVDPVGCPLDLDGDGVSDDKDRCPATPPGAAVDENGCPRDDDADGIPNHLDKCPNSATGVRIDVAGCEIKDVIRLPGVNFETGSDRLLLGTEYLLERAAATLKKYPDLQIEVAGHTDSVGTGDANFSLSERRAKTVRNYLIRYGIDPSRLTATGYGESQPIADNDTTQGRATNRRVELRIVNR